VVGNPARLIRSRHNVEDIARLLSVAWWNWPVTRITQHLRIIMSGTIDDLERAAP
jgi:virginiamycin A acetyltransferase